MTRAGAASFAKKHAKQIRDFCEMIQVEKILMFASDYPHYDYDDPTRTLAQIPKEARRAVEADTALDEPAREQA